MLQEFKDLVDSASSRIATFSNDHIQICDYLKIDITTHYSGSMVTDHLSHHIEHLLTPVDGTVGFTVQMQSDLTDGLVYDALFSKTDNSIYLIILKILTGRRIDLVALDYGSSWSEAVAVAKDYQAFAPNVYTLHEDLRENYPKQHDVAQTALSLRAMGCDIVLDDVTIEVKSGLEKIAEEIAADISSVGSLFFINAIFQHLVQENKFFQVYQRYLIINEITMMPHDTKAMMPYGYLLNIAIKQASISHNTYNQEQLNEIFNRIGHKATLLGAILNVRYYGTFEVHFQSPRTLPQFVRRLALFDSAFSFPSMDMKEVIEYMSELFKWLDATRFSNRFGFSIADFIAVTSAIEKHAIPNGPMMITLAFLKDALPAVPENIFPAILHKLAHQLGDVNKDYVLLTDYDKLDFGFKPLIQLSSPEFLLCDKSWCAIGFYEVLAALARELDTTRDELISRINAINESNTTAWGKMNVYQVLKHCSLWDEWMQNDQNNKQAFIGRLFGKMALKKVLGDESPLARNTPTLPEFRIKETTGDIASEKNKWISLINEYVHFSNPGFIHPFFGKMTKEQVGQMAYKHADHHLCQING